MSRGLQGVCPNLSSARQIAARTLGDLVRKLGEKILPEIIPILEEGLRSPKSDERQGVCIGLSEIMKSTSRDAVSMSSGPAGPPPTQRARGLGCGEHVLRARRPAPHPLSEGLGVWDAVSMSSGPAGLPPTHLRGPGGEGSRRSCSINDTAPSGTRQPHSRGCCGQ